LMNVGEPKIFLKEGEGTVGRAIRTVKGKRDRVVWSVLTFEGEHRPKQRKGKKEGKKFECVLRNKCRGGETPVVVQREKCDLRGPGHAKRPQ